MADTMHVPLQPAPDSEKKKDGEPKPDSAKQLVLGLCFGVVFGFLLQKGGVAKYDILIGALLLTDFTVMKIMLTAIVVGMVGVFAMHSRGLVQLHLKPTRYAANVAGGLIFGIGFALLGYCPGTGAAALGQGNLDAVAGIAGLLAGSYLYAMCSRKLSATILAIGNRGGIMLPDLFNMRSGLFLAGFVPLLLLSLVLLEAYTG
ncbi:MAG: YeeE/YedE thiosulfate transporter family protein [Gammaproteobacteria bacterium]